MSRGQQYPKGQNFLRTQALTQTVTVNFGFVDLFVPFAQEFLFNFFNKKQFLWSTRKLLFSVI